MPADEARQLLNDGIRAARSGERSRARELLLKVVAADERVEPAWLWLSAVLDDPADQLTALENVLVLSPKHPQALAGVAVLRQRLGRAAAPDPGQALAASSPLSAGAGELDPAPAAESEPGSYGWAPSADPPRASPAEPVTVEFTASDPEEAPFQCVFCGRPTEPEATRCPHCRRNLLVRRKWKPGGSLYLLLLLLGLHFQSALVQALAAWLNDGYPTVLAGMPAVATFTVNWLPAALARVILWVLVLLLLLSDIDGGYGLAVGAGVLDIGWGAAAYYLGVMNPVVVAINAGLGAGVVLASLSAMLGLARGRERARVVLDKNVTGAIMYHERAVAYARQRQWALAALHWRRAVALAPNTPGYYKGLGEARLRLGRTELARQAFESGRSLAPSDPEFDSLLGALPEG